MVPTRVDRANRVVGVAAFVGALALAACAGADADVQGDDPLACLDVPNGPLMRPGENCLRCHSEGTDTGAPVWSLGGTVFPSPDADRCDGVEGAVVRVMDEAKNPIVELTTSAAGNFWTAVPLPENFRVAVVYEGRTIEMPVSPPAGSCNACHSQPPIGGAPGRIYLP